ncbi:penicillin-binding transpeptidase domain-containing protein [Bacteroides sp. AN502(2024)]|uniref:penicillin-binding transpeptidase domain-containing protein n=1 Tax=Bacteroides sp. AN502(2024) TaxID=3160599 RepID=UPI003514C086
MVGVLLILLVVFTAYRFTKISAAPVSTIDSTLQVKVDSILQNKLSELNAISGQVIVMEVQTGEIKASVGSDSILQESGLVRIASLLAALETKTVKLSDTVDVGNGILVIDKDTLLDRNWHRGGYGEITVEQGVGVASNIANYKTVRKAFGDERAFAETLARYGYQVKDTSFVYNPLGYGILTTPLQNLTFYNAIAKGTAASVDSVKQTLEYAVTDGLAKPAKSDKVKVAGATGTVRLPNDEYAVEFCGYFPTDSPKYSIIVSIRKKGLPASGGLMAGDVFRQIMNDIVEEEL